jgi:starvation-inducible DNA-binding protein
MNYSVNSSKNSGRPNETVSKTIQLLNRQLADTVDLRSQARQAHFNVRGAHIQELRSLFDGLARDVRHFADLLAARITASGGTATATVRFSANESALRDYPMDAFDARDHLEALLSSYSRYEWDTRNNIKALQEIQDFESVRLLQVILGSIERSLWFLEAYLEGMAIGLHGRKLPPWTSAFEVANGNGRKRATSSGVA